MARKLKPCPFCGGEARIIELRDEGAANEGGSVAECTHCQASSAVEFNFKETLLERWNRRRKPTRDEAREEITKIAEKYAPLIQAEIAKLFVGFGVDKAALTYRNCSFAACLDEMLQEGAYEDLNAIEDDAE